MTEPALLHAEATDPLEDGRIGLRCRFTDGTEAVAVRLPASFEQLASGIAGALPSATEGDETGEAVADGYSHGLVLRIPSCPEGIVVDGNRPGLARRLSTVLGIHPGS